MSRVDISTAGSSCSKLKQTRRGIKASLVRVASVGALQSLQEIGWHIFQQEPLTTSLQQPCQHLCKTFKSKRILLRVYCMCNKIESPLLLLTRSSLLGMITQGRIFRCALRKTEISDKVSDIQCALQGIKTFCRPRDM